MSGTNRYTNSRTPMKSTDQSELVDMINSSALPPDVKVGLLKILDPSAKLPDADSGNTDPDTDIPDITPRSW